MEKIKLKNADKKSLKKIRTSKDKGSSLLQKEKSQIFTFQSFKSLPPPPKVEVQRIPPPNQFYLPPPVHPLHVVERRMSAMPPVGVVASQQSPLGASKSFCIKENTFFFMPPCPTNPSMDAPDGQALQSLRIRYSESI